jgi:hypothetical protein
VSVCVFVTQTKINLINLKMSKYSTIVVALVLVAQILGHGISTRADQGSSSSSSVDANRQNGLANSDNNNNNQRGQNYLLDGQASSFGSPKSHQTTAMKNVDLIELTPSLEQQLYQAKRLNNGDPDSGIESAKLANDALRYEVTGQLQRFAEGRPSMGAHNRYGRQWLDSIRMPKAAIRLSNSDNNNNDNYGMAPINYDNESQRRFSRGLAVTRVPQVGREQEKDYGLLVDATPVSSSSQAPIENQEGASRNSLWTSELLRDLLIAQEARNR